MAGTYPKGLQLRLNSIAYKYQGHLLDRVSNEIAKFEATGSLQESLKVRVIPATDERAPEIQMEYAEHGDLLGKRKLLFTKLANPGEQFEWLEARGISPSKVPGYKGDAPNLSAEKKRERFAFAIARDKKQNDTHKRMQWKKKALPELLRAINVEIMEAYAREVEQALVKELTT